LFTTLIIFFALGFDTETAFFLIVFAVTFFAAIFFLTAVFTAVLAFLATTGFAFVTAVFLAAILGLAAAFLGAVFFLDDFSHNILLFSP